MVRTIIYDKVTALTAAQAMTAGLYTQSDGQGRHRNQSVDAGFKYLL